MVRETRQALQFTQTFYRFDVRGDAKVGDVVGRVWVTVPADSTGAVVVYFLRPRNEHFDVNQTTGVIYVIKDLSQWSDPAGRPQDVQRRRRRSVVPVELHVVAQYGHFEAEVTIQLAINRTGCCGVTGSQTNHVPGLY